MAAIPKLSFAGGEVTPSLYGRVDLTKYKTGARTMRNFMVMRHGGATNRPGSEFIVETKDSSNTSILRKFVFNASQTYMLEFGDSYIRFIRDGAQITVSGVTAWSGATTYVIGDLVVEGGVNYYCILGHVPSQQPPNATYWYALTGSVYEIPTPYAEADLLTLHFDQSADIVTITHPTYAARELARTAHTTWTLTAKTFAPSISAPTNEAVTGGTGTGQDWTYKITAVKTDSLEESLPSAAVTLSDKAAPTVAAANIVTWDAVTDAQEYNVYRQKSVKTGNTGDGVYGFLGTSDTGRTFNDDSSVTPNFTDTPPISRDPFSGAGNFPSTSVYYQGRHLFANTNNNTETIEASRSGSFDNFTIRSPLQDDDALTFQVPGRQVNAVRAMLDLGRLIVLTAGGEWLIAGDSAGTLLPDQINPRQQSYNGSATLQPLIVGSTALYVQARASVIRNLDFDIQKDRYAGDELSIFSAHLFDGFTIIDWDWQQIPHSIVWAVRSDGTLMGLTYIPEHEVVGWHTHDFSGGTVERVQVIPEGTEDRVYVIVNRTIDGSTTRYIERLASRQFTNILSAIFVDSALSFDGRNTAATTMTLTGGTDWLHTETLTLTSSVAFFLSGDVGNVIQLNILDDDGEISDRVRCEITAFTSTTIVSVTPHKTVPAALQATATTNWWEAVDTLSGLDHLEGEDVSVFADGFVVANPNNPSHKTITVSSGSITLARPYAVIRVGLPITADIETLNLSPSDESSLSEKRMLVNKVSIHVEASRGIWAGTEPPDDDFVGPNSGLTEHKQRDTEGYDDPVALATDIVDINIRSTFNNNGRVFIRQSDPIPLSVLAVIPSGFVPVGAS